MAINDHIDSTESEDSFPDHYLIDVTAFELDGSIYCAKCAGCNSSLGVYIEQNLHDEIVVCDRCGEVIYND